MSTAGSSLQVTTYGNNAACRWLSVCCWCCFFFWYSICLLCLKKRILKVWKFFFLSLDQLFPSLLSPQITHQKRYFVFRYYCICIYHLYKFFHRCGSRKSQGTVERTCSRKNSLQEPSRIPKYNISLFCTIAVEELLVCSVRVLFIELFFVQVYFYL